MNIEPCVRLGMRISPKISENPADSRNNRPPKVTLLTVSSSQNVICGAFPLLAATHVQTYFVARIAQSAIRGSPTFPGFRFRLRAPRSGGLQPAEARAASVGGSLNPRLGLQHLVSGG